jgi:hypothetical protein
MQRKMAAAYESLQVFIIMSVVIHQYTDQNSEQSVNIRSMKIFLAWTASFKEQTRSWCNSEWRKSFCG